MDRIAPVCRVSRSFSIGISSANYTSARDPFFKGKLNGWRSNSSKSSYHVHICYLTKEPTWPTRMRQDPSVNSGKH